jgi:hypothetical protein
MYSNASIEMAPGQYFSNVYVTTVQEQSGYFNSVCGTGCQVYDPAAPNYPFPGNTIPRSRLPNPANPTVSGVFAFEFQSTPEPAQLPLMAAALVALLLGRRFATRPGIF